MNSFDFVFTDGTTVSATGDAIKFEGGFAAVYQKGVLVVAYPAERIKEVRR